MAVFFLFPANFFIAFRLRDIRALIGRRAISYSARRWIYACRHLYRKGQTVSILVNQIWYCFYTRKKLIVYTKSAVNSSPPKIPQQSPFNTQTPPNTQTPFFARIFTKSNRRHSLCLQTVLSSQNPPAAATPINTSNPTRTPSSTKAAVVCEQ